MKNVRLGIIGLGNMGAAHARTVLEGKAPGLELAAVADRNADKRALFPEVPGYETPEALIASGEVDAVLIATPHYSHTTIGCSALEAGLHVMVEKPISVHKADCEKLIAAWRARRGRRRPVFAAMFNQRTDPFYRKIRELVQRGEIGRVQRINWIITTWFRPEVYYSMGGWRATWAGEGGGVLLNQCPHNLDLLQWIFGMTARVHAHCGFGRYHAIEVEDDVTAYLEFTDGATGVFIASTGEAPGTNRLEVAGDRGRLVYENERLVFTRNEVPVSEFSRTTDVMFGKPATWEVTFPELSGHGGQHVEILRNFADAIRHGAELIAPAAEGIHSVELANAMLLSAWTGRMVEVPIDAAAYARRLRRKIRESKPRSGPVRRTGPVDLSGSFS